MTNQRPTDQRPLPAEIYMRRRLAALLILLVVVGLVVWGLSAWARNKDPESAATVPTTPVAETSVQDSKQDQDESAEQTVTETVTSTSKQRPEGGAQPVAKGACDINDLRVSALSEQPSYAEGEQPVFYMEVFNPTDTDCVVELDDDTLRFEVYNMATNQRIWADTDCSPAVVTGSQTFAAGDKRTFQARWSGSGSQPGQCSERQPVAPGSYYLHTVIGENASAPAPFNL